MQAVLTLPVGLRLADREMGDLASFAVADKISNASTLAWMVAHFGAVYDVLKHPPGGVLPPLGSLQHVDIPSIHGFDDDHHPEDVDHHPMFRSNILAIGVALFDERVFELFRLIPERFGSVVDFNNFLCDGVQRRSCNLYHLILGVQFHEGPHRRPEDGAGLPVAITVIDETEIRSQVHFLIRVLRELRGLGVDPEWCAMKPWNRGPDGIQRNRPLELLAFQEYLKQPLRRPLRAAFLALSGCDWEQVSRFPSGDFEEWPSPGDEMLFKRHGSLLEDVILRRHTQSYIKKCPLLPSFYVISGR